MKKKLIEVALPLDDINKAAAREKSIRHGHPSTLHLWWARRPLAACRAVLFAQLVDDPSAHPDKFPTEEAQTKERERLFDIIRRLVVWENSTNEKVLAEAHAEILKSCDGKPPPICDPFSGGGSIPLEAQRLGLVAHGSDLNPVAVLIGKALIEIPPRFARRPPVNPNARKGSAMRSWRGTQGLAEDVRYYGKWIRDEAERRIGYLYPKAKLPTEHGGGEATVIAWLWARVVKCPNPACGARMPLARSFVLAMKEGKETCVEPVVHRETVPPTIEFRVKSGAGGPPPGMVTRTSARCLACQTSVPLEHVRVEGRAKRLGDQLMAIVAEGDRGRIYLPPNAEHESIAREAQPAWAPDTDLPVQALGFRVQAYGMTKHRDLFTARQTVALSTFCDLVGEVRTLVLRDALESGLPADGEPLSDGGHGAQAYADAVATYAGFGVDRSADFWCTAALWSPQPKNEIVGHAFGRPALSMSWDFGEINPFSESGGNYLGNLGYVADSLSTLGIGQEGHVVQKSAVDARQSRFAFSSDPPYYDNIGYSDLSDFFYVWMRRWGSPIWSSVLNTVLVPKAGELIASPERFQGNRAQAQQFFEDGLARAFGAMRSDQIPSLPLTIYYAFKQTEEDAPEVEGLVSTMASTGWETMLEGLLRSGFVVNGTWPMRTERSGGLRESKRNALASSIVLVCRLRSDDAPVVTRRDFLAALKSELPEALRELQQGHVAPVDLAQASIGPGMAIFSRHAKVLEPDGQPMRVRTALQIINETLDEVLSEQEGEFDADTRWAIAWFEQFGFDEGPYGQAETLSTAKNTSVSGLVEAGILKSRAGKVRLLRREELQADWDPATDERFTVWETTQYLVHALEKDGESAAAALLGKLGGNGDIARDLVYRLYSICERKKWAQEALAYNALVTSWADITRLAAQAPMAEPSEKQGTLL